MSLYREFFRFAAAAAIGIGLLLAVSTTPGWSVGQKGGVTPMAMCNPETNPDCEDGGGGGGSGPCPINCTTQGKTTGTSYVRDTNACWYDPIQDKHFYAGTKITYRQATGSNCTTANLTCWDGVACKFCLK